MTPEIIPPTTSPIRWQSGLSLLRQLLGMQTPKSDNLSTLNIKLKTINPGLTQNLKIKVLLIFMVLVTTQFYMLSW